MKTVLIVTHRRGFEADLVVDALRKRDIPVFRLNCDNGKDASMVSFLFFSDNNNIILSCDNVEVSKNQLGIGWCQQLPPFLSQTSNVSQCLQNRNIWIPCFASLGLLGLNWLNEPDNVARASNKITQLTFARKVGLNIPSTLVSNTPKHIRDFANNNVIVAKNLATPWFVNSKQETIVAYTKIVDPEWLIDDAELYFSPVIYQSFCKRKKDYRVVVVGDRSFAVSCIPKENQLEDIRRGVLTGEDFIICDFDQDSLDALKLLMNKLGVDYCAADFMEDELGKMYFLEMNICGAWWWVDRLYDGAICKAITDFIENRLNFSR